MRSESGDLCNPERRRGGNLFCPKCGSEVEEGYLYCNNCGAMVGRGYPGKPIEEGNPYVIITFLGYAFGLLGGWIGLGFGVYLLTREHPRAKFHGKMILILTFFMIIFWPLVIFYST